MTNITLPDSLKTKGALVILGGESREEMLRTWQAIRYYWQINAALHRDIPIVATGYCSGLTPAYQRPAKEDAESARSKKLLIEKGVPEALIKTEADSLDTLTNFVCAEPLLKQIGEKNIGVIVDAASSDRVLWTAKRVLGREYNVDIYGVDEPASVFAKLVIVAVHNANKIDTRLFRVPSGNQEAWRRYVREHHPFYAKGLEKFASVYGLGVLGMKAMNGAKRYLAKNST